MQSVRFIKIKIRILISLYLAVPLTLVVYSSEKTTQGLFRIAIISIDKFETMIFTLRKTKLLGVLMVNELGNPE